MIQKKEKEVPMDTSTFKKETWMSQKNLQEIGLKVNIYCIQIFKLINFKNIIRFIFL